MKKLISALLAAALTLGLSACGSTATVDSTASSQSTAASSEAASEATSEATSDTAFTGDGFAADVDYASLAGTTIKVGASPVPHAEILKVAGEILAQADITLDVVEFTDYIQPNLATENGTVDASYFKNIV